MALNENNEITLDNLDELEVHLTIIAKNPSAVKSAGSFLTRRDWPTQILSNANEAIEAIAKDKPDFVLLSYNHPQLNVDKIANILAQTFNMTCVGFCEKEERAATSKFHSSKLKYKLSGGASGPTIHRFVRKLLIEKYGLNIVEEKAQKEGAAEQGEDDSDQIIIKSGKGYGKTSVMKGEQLETGSVNLGSNGEKDFDSGVHIQEGVTTKGKTKVLDGVANRSGSVTQEGGPDGKIDSLLSEGAEVTVMDAVQEGIGRRNKSAKKNSGKKRLGKKSDGVGTNRHAKFVDDGEEDESELAESVELEAEVEAEEHELSNVEVTRARGPVGAVEIDSYREKDEIVESENEVELNLPEESTAGRQIQKKKRLSAVTKAKISQGLREEKKENLNAKEETLHSSMTQMIEHIGSVGEKLGSHPDDPVEWIGILPIVAKDFQGYLAIPVLMQPNEEAEETLKKVRQSVSEDLQKKGFEPKIEDGFFIQVDPTYFSNLAKGRAQFVLQQGINEDSELCVSYFASPPPAQSIQKVNKTMSTIHVDGVSTEHPIDFKVYLHLDKNKKYFLYLNTGRTLSDAQKSRLKDRGVSSFFIKNSEVTNFRKHLASTFVKKLIVSLKEELLAEERKAENQ